MTNWSRRFRVVACCGCGSHRGLKRRGCEHPSTDRRSKSCENPPIPAWCVWVSLARTRWWCSFISRERRLFFSEQVQPVLKLPISAERVFWEVITPKDDHLIWYTPILGQAMKWQFDRWHLHRQPLQTAAELAVWAGGQPSDSRLPQGNRYLFVGVEASGLRVVTMSRLAIWMLVGTIVLGVSCLLTYYPTLRHPLLAMFAAVFLGGLTWLLPDASVLVAQVMLVAMLMVGVIAGVGHLLVPRRPGRVLVPGGDRSSLRGRMPQASGAGVALVAAPGTPSLTAAVPGRGSTAEAR